MNKKLLLIFIGALLFRIVISFIYWHPDVNSNADWGVRFFQYGPARFFAPESNVWNFTWPNQPPGSIYLFACVRKLFEFLFYNVFSPLHFRLHIFPGSWLLFFEDNLYPALLKLPSILADLGIGYLVYLLVKKLKDEKAAFFGTVLWLANPVIWYNSSVWGQTDAVISFFAILAFYLLLEERIIWAVLAMAISIYIKISLFIFVPIFIIIAIRQKYKFSQYFFAIVYSLLAIGIATLPFSRGEPFSWLIHLYQTKVLGQQLQIITANAFNIWTTIASINERPQTTLLGPLSYQWWGIMLFTISYIPVLYKVWKRQDGKTVVVALALAAFASWMLLTNMHERYLYPLFPYLTVLVAVGSVDLLAYWLISGISLLNLYNFWWYPNIDVMVNLLSFGQRVIPRILGIVNFILFLLLYREGFRQSRLRQRSD